MKYQHIKNGSIIEVLEVNEKSKSVLYSDESGKTKAFTSSTLKRWYKPLEEEEPIKVEPKKAVKKPVPSDDVCADGRPYAEIGKEIAAQAKERAAKVKSDKKAAPKKKREMQEYVSEALEFIYSKVEANGDEIFKPAKDINMRAFKVGGHMYCKFNYGLTSITIAVSSKSFSEKNLIAPTRTINHSFDNLYVFDKALTKADKDMIVKILKIAREYRIDKNNHSSQKKTSKKKEAK